MSAAIKKEKTMKQMKTGRVKWYDEIKGFGFIATAEGNDVFVHRTGLTSSYDGLQPEQEVMFETKQGDKGLYAFNVRSAG